MVSAHSRAAAAAGDPSTATQMLRDKFVCSTTDQASAVSATCEILLLALLSFLATPAAECSRDHDDALLALLQWLIAAMNHWRRMMC